MCDGTPCPCNLYEGRHRRPRRRVGESIDGSVAGTVLLLVIGVAMTLALLVVLLYTIWPCPDGTFTQYDSLGFSRECIAR